jgi:integrase
MTRGTLQFGGNTVKVWVDDSGDGISASSNRPKETLRFQEFAEKYAKDCLGMMKPASQISIKSNIRILNQTFGKMRLSQIGTEEIQKFASNHPFSPVTVKNRLATMRMIWTKARAWKYTKENPFEFLSMPRQSSHEVQRLSVEDMCAILRKNSGYLRTMLWILAETGIRGGELCGLYKSDVDARMIRIARSAFRKQIQTPKTENAVRNIAISGQLARHLSSFAGALGTEPPAGKDHLMMPSKPSLTAGARELIFSMPDGRPWDNGEITRRLGIGLHQFRHANASLMASLGVPEHIRRERLGHSAGNVTARYTHSSPEDHQRWAEAIGNAIYTENVQSFAMGAD